MSEYTSPSYSPSNKVTAGYGFTLLLAYLSKNSYLNSFKLKSSFGLKYGPYLSNNSSNTLELYAYPVTLGVSKKIKSWDVSSGLTLHISPVETYNNGSALIRGYENALGLYFHVEREINSNIIWGLRYTLMEYKHKKPISGLKSVFDASHVSVSLSFN